MSATGIDDTQRAARLLLKHPLIRASDEERYRLVRRAAAPLHDWFDTNTGWSVYVDSAVVRLYREPATLTVATHPFAVNGVAFSRRRYVLLMLCLAVLERADAQIALGRMAELVVVQAQDPELAAAGFAFTLDGYDERRDLVAAVHLLLRWGVLARVAGDEQEYVRHGGDALYDVSRRVLATLLVTRRSPSMVAGADLETRMHGMRDRGIPPTDELRNLRLRQTLTRRLLDEPVLYFDELGDDEAAYLRSQRSLITRRVTELTGLVPEIRREGIAMVDLEDDLTDLRMPEKGTDGHVTLLVAERLATSGDTTVDTLRTFVREITPQFSGFWRGDAQQPGAETGLVDTALSRLAALELIVRDGEAVRVRPALARFSVADPIITGGTRA
ncbi:TIGR02678 family protein [Rhodoglobus aureus]|uniref:TIGR02678 family protein n=1 Tax=Rhodoglobus aureus TaxID=191497 RepID=A0ABN1VCM8_9MICO